jgi:hypothetical protein
VLPLFISVIAGKFLSTRYRMSGSRNCSTLA